MTPLDVAAVPAIGRASLLEAGAAAPEAAATHELFERHGARIHGYCLRQLGSREEAEDAVQTTFMNAFGALRRGVVPEAEAAWLFKIAENVCLSRRRSSWRRGRIESPADFGVIEEVVASPETRRDELIGIEDALAAMPTQQRRAILLREWQGLSYREIAAELDVSQGAVETLIFRARRSLARGLTEPEVVKPRRGLRKALRVGDIASFFMGAKALLGGTAAANAAVAAVTVAAVAGVTARPASEIVPDTVKVPPAPVVVKTAPPSRAVVTPLTRAAEERVEQAQTPAFVEPTAVAKREARAAAKPRQAAPRARATPARAVPPPGHRPAGETPAAPGRAISDGRRDATGEPDTKPPKPTHAATPTRPEQAATPLKPVKPSKPDKLTPTSGAAPPKADAPKEQPSTSNRPVAPPVNPEEKRLPEQAAAVSEPGPPAEPRPVKKDESLATDGT
jgi:RNA polymerase sigma factor (sigma-70 family)